MKKVKTWLILLITILLILGIASLPVLTAAALDRNHLNKPGSREMASIALDLSGERQALSPAGKIDLLSRGKTIGITEREASRTAAEINGALEEQMDAYVAAGIFEWFGYTSWIAQPYLCVDLEEPDNYSIFWSVTIVNENKPYQSLGVDLDDETGKIYSIRYDVYGEYDLDGVWERNAATLDAFAHIYLDQLDFMEDPQNMGPNMEYGELDGEVLCGAFSMKDQEYGEIGIEFYTTGSGGFWIYFPE